MRMDPIVSLFSILGALILGAIRPGPSFLFVARTAVAVSRRSDVASAAGMGLGASIVCALALLGVRAVLAQAEWLYATFKLLGAIYLCYLAWRLGAAVKSQWLYQRGAPAANEGRCRPQFLACRCQST
jgi:threonine/homoserine/homoserine lactone efflux protein